MSTADDNDKTVIRPRARVRADDDDDVSTGLQAERRRGRAAAAEQPGHTLPIGTRLRDYEITGLIGEGGFGIVYLAWDHSLQRKVAVKEYMPASMAARVNGSSAIVVKSERHLDTFKAGLKSFVNEARLLARFDHPSLVKVYRFWEENGTAYMVMPYYAGPTLKTALAELGHAPGEDELRAWLRPLLDALRVMHAAQCYHRDIAPDNILLTPRGPLLLDFGAARRVIGDMTHAITVVLKPGYAPIEQYGDVASMAQGAWTDLYALACVVYYAITGKTPMSSVERLMDDRLEPLEVTEAGRYSPAFLRAIDAALAVRPADRPQDERRFRALLDADRPAPSDFTGLPSGYDDGDAPEQPYSTVPGTLTPESATRVEVRPTVPSTGVAAPPLPAPAAPATPRPAPTARIARTGTRLWLMLLAGLAVIAAAMFWWLRGSSDADTPSGAAAVDSAALAPTPSIASSPLSAASATSISASAIVAAPAPASVEPRVGEPAQSASPADAAATAPVVAPAIEATPTPAEPAPVERPPVVRDAGLPVPGALPASSRPRRETAPARSDAPPPKPVATPRIVGARCSDILQKASLEPLTADEADYLKRECR